MISARLVLSSAVSCRSCLDSFTKKLNVYWQMAELSRPCLGKLGQLILIHTAFLFQMISQTCSYGNDRGQEVRKPVSRCLSSLFSIQVC